MKEKIHDLKTAPSKEQGKPLTDEQVTSLRDTFAQTLGDVYVCGRVWEAWNYGTMSKGDFQPAGECEEVLDSLTTAVYEALKAVPPKEPEQEPFTYYDPVRDSIRPFRGEGDIHGETTTPTQRKPWVSLSEEDREQHRDSWRSNIHDKEIKAIEAKLRELNEAPQLKPLDHHEFGYWWLEYGSGLHPLEGEDQEQHAYRVARAAWGAAHGEDT